MRDTEPSATLQFNLANITAPDNPQFDTNDPAVAVRVQQRLQTPLTQLLVCSMSHTTPPGGVARGEDQRCKAPR